MKEISDQMREIDLELFDVPEIKEAITLTEEVMRRLMSQNFAKLYELLPNQW